MVKQKYQSELYITSNNFKPNWKIIKNITNCSKNEFSIQLIQISRVNNYLSLIN